MSPVNYAKELARVQTYGGALSMAEKCVRHMQDAITHGGAPYADEVDVQEHTYTDQDTKQQKTRSTIVIDQGAVALRMGKNLTFWKNVVSYLKNRQPLKASH